ncbi:MAG: hypothetical protein CSA62_02420 [Planctomycetota bacterium]|nr:MAG: hypothetical protein CSA62_02420 [Planctomycetota bacterium]
MSLVELRLPQQMLGLRSAKELERVQFPELSEGQAAQLVDPIGEERLEASCRRQAIQELSEQISLTVQQLNGLVASRLEELSRYAVELGLGLAERLVEHEIDMGRMDPTKHVVECLRNAIQGLGSGSILVKLNPADLSNVLSEIDALDAPEIQNNHAVRYEVDASIGRGACRVETSIGRVIHDPREVVAEALNRVREEAGFEPS